MAQRNRAIILDIKLHAQSDANESRRPTRRIHDYEQLWCSSDDLLFDKRSKSSDWWNTISSDPLVQSEVRLRPGDTEQQYDTRTQWLHYWKSIHYHSTKLEYWTASSAGGSQKTSERSNNVSAEYFGEIFTASHTTPTGSHHHSSVLFYAKSVSSQLMWFLCLGEVRPPPPAPASPIQVRSSLSRIMTHVYVLGSATSTASCDTTSHSLLKKSIDSVRAHCSPVDFSGHSRTTTSGSTSAAISSGRKTTSTTSSTAAPHDRRTVRLVPTETTGYDHRTLATLSTLRPTPSSSRTSTRAFHVTELL